MDRDGLVAFPDELPAGGIRRAIVVAAAVVFILIVGGTAVVDTVAPAPMPQLIGAERRRDARLRSAARFRDGSLFRLWEHDLRLSSRIRRRVSDSYGWFLYRRLGHVQGNLVAGPNGWLFLANRITVPDREDRVIARLAGAVMAAVDRRIHANGMRAVFIPVPRKAAIHADQLPGALDPRADVDRAVIHDLIVRGIATVDLWPALTGGLSGPAFHMLGSHWTDEAQRVAAAEVAEICGAAPGEGADDRVVVAKGLSLAVDTDLLRFGGILGEHEVPSTAAREVLNLVGPDPRHPPSMLEEQPGRVVILGSSFTQRRKFPGFVAHYLGDKLWSGARAGGLPGDVFAEFMRRSYTPGATELVLFEVPCHHLVKQPLIAIADPVFAEPPPPVIVRYRPARGGELRVEAGKPSSIGEGVVLVRLPPGSVAHTGEGVVALRVRGKSANGVTLKLAVPGGDVLEIPWRKRVGEVDVPLIAPSPSSGAIQLTAHSRSAHAGSREITVDSVEIVSEAPPLPRIDLGPSEPVAARKGWKVVLDPPPATPLGALALLELGLGVDGSFAGDLRVEVLAHGETRPLRAQWRGLTRGALVVVSLAPLRGKAIETIRLTGSGDAPRRLLHRAVLRPGT